MSNHRLNYASPKIYIALSFLIFAQAPLSLLAQETATKALNNNALNAYVACYPSPGLSGFIENGMGALGIKNENSPMVGVFEQEKMLLIPGLDKDQPFLLDHLCGSRGFSGLTKAGQCYLLAGLLNNPTTDVAVLKQRQKAIRFFIDHPEQREKILKAADEIKKYEDTFVFFGSSDTDKEYVNGCLSRKSYQDWFLSQSLKKRLNTSVYALNGHPFF